MMFISTSARRVGRVAMAAVAGFTSGNVVAADTTAGDQPGSMEQLQEVVVMGEKRETTVLDTPAALTVFGDQQIKDAGITSSSDYLHMLPNVTFFNDNASQSQVAIRGQGAARTADQSVAFVVDGVSLTNSMLFDNNLYDIQQIEVYKGPQSTIYGRNASGGALVVTTKLPTDVEEGSVTAGFGNWNTWNADASFSAPIAEGLKFRLSADTLTTDGPFVNETTKGTVRAHRDNSARLVLQYDPTEALDVIVRASALRSTGDGLAYNAQFPGLAIGGVPVPVLNANQTNIPYVANINGAGNRTIYDGNVTVNYELGFAKLTSVTDYSYLTSLEYAGNLVPYTPNAPSPPGTAGTQSQWISNKSFSEDIRLVSPNSQRLRWMAGAYYLHLDRTSMVALGEDLQGVAVPANYGLQGPGTINPTISYINDRPDDKNYAGYANVQFDIIHNLELSLAGRYDIEKKSQQELAPDAINPLTGVNYNLCLLALGPPISNCRREETFHKATPKFTLNYKTSFGSFYASYGEGFKSGGYNPIGTRAATLAAAAAAGQPTSNLYVQDSYKAETTQTYEFGVKARLLNDRLAFNIGAYHTLVSNEQEFVFFPTAGIQAIQSIDAVRLRGFDADFTLALPAGVVIAGAYGYNDGKITEYLANPAYVGHFAPLSLKDTVNASVLDVIHLPNDASLTPRIEFQRQGEIYWDAQQLPGTGRDPINLVNGNLTLNKGNWELALWAKNIFDKEYNAEFVPLAGVLSVVYKGDPRSFGGNLTYRFK